MFKLYLNHISCTQLPLTAFRIALGFLGLIDLISRWSLVKHLYSESGVVTCNAAWVINAYYGHLPNLNCFVPSIYSQYALLIVGMLAFLGFILGRYIRLSIFVAWVILFSFYDRNSLALYGGDMLLIRILFWSLFVPWTSTYTDSSQSTSWWHSRLPCGLTLLKGQILLMHIFTALVKTGAGWTKDFSAVENALKLDFLRSDLGLADFILSQPYLGQILTIIALVIEYIAPVLLVSPANRSWGRKLRWCGIILFATLHVGIFFSLNIFLFQPLVIVCLIPFIPPPLPLDPPHENVADAKKYSGIFWRPLIKNFSSISIAELLSTLLFIFAIASSTRLTENLSPVALLRALHLEQPWYMFAPEPPRTNVLSTATGYLANGEKVELFPTDFRKLHLRTRTFLAYTPKVPNIARIYAVYFCRQNLFKPPEQHFEKVVIYRLTKDSKNPMAFTYCD